MTAGNALQPSVPMSFDIYFRACITFAHVLPLHIPTPMFLFLIPDYGMSAIESCPILIINVCSLLSPCELSTRGTQVCVCVCVCGGGGGGGGGA